MAAGHRWQQGDAKMLEGCKNLTMAEPVVTVRGAVNEQAKEQIQELALVL